MVLQAWNTQTSTELSLSGPAGQVYSMVVGNDLLFAGTQVIFLDYEYMFHNNMLYLNICTCLIGSFRSGFYDALDPIV